MSSLPFVLVTAPLAAYERERLQELACGLHIEVWHAREMGAVSQALWEQTEVLYTSFATPLPTPAEVPRLRWVQLYSAGPDQVLTHPLFASEVHFTTTSGIHAVTIAEHVLTMLLAWFHRLPQLLQWQQRAAWPQRRERATLFGAEELRGKTLGIVGYGSIGRELARLADAFGMRVLAMQRGSEHRDPGFVLPGVGDPEGTLPARYYSPDALPALLPECDVVVLAAPLTAQTRGMFDAAAFEAMKRSAFLVNIARGALCDEAALLRALQEQRIAGAALDVFEQEPLPAEHALWKCPNVFISPHSSGLSAHYDERAAAVFRENLRRYLGAEPLLNAVDKAQGY
ncbi:MAG TPA: D-2-hydroxyacid dehydrogenase [Ktedonobacteraceae bacterium]|jgi:phosphoglycerate dehydrogenase-like enzyme